MTFTELLNKHGHTDKETVDIGGPCTVIRTGAGYDDRLVIVRT